MTAAIVRADARSLPLPDASVDLIVTSPPYFALRSYTDAGAHYAGQVGGEATPAEYIAALVDCTREWVRVLKPSGSMFVNLGDKYANRTQGAYRGSSDGLLGRGDAPARPARNGAISEKSLMLLPERYRIACVDELGLIARAVIVWAKPNGLPESVTDRVRRAHEDWVHLTKAPRYFAAVDEIREGHSENTHARRKDGGVPPKNAAALAVGVRRGYFGETTFNPLGKLPGSVWEVPTQPLTVPKELGVDHFAAFPMEWPRRIILGWSPAGICVECGEGRRPMVDSKAMEWRESPTIAGRSNGGSRKPMSGTMLSPAERTIIGYACKCAEPTAPSRPSVVLDPFGGTGTTALVASVLGRVGISVDLSGDYCRLARWRTTDPGQRAAAMLVDKPEPVAETQLSLWEAAS